MLLFAIAVTILNREVMIGIDCFISCAEAGLHSSTWPFVNDQHLSDRERFRVTLTYFSIFGSIFVYSWSLVRWKTRNSAFCELLKAVF